MGTMILNKVNHNYNRVLKKNVTPYQESVISLIFYSLQGAERQNIQTDHSLSVKNIRTLNIEQVQSLINTHCKVSHSRDDIVDALKAIKQPNAVDIVETYFTSEIDGGGFDGIRLHYTDTPVDASELTNINNLENIKSELSEMKLFEKEETPPIDLMVFKKIGSCKETATDWKSKAFELYEQQTIDRDTIQSLRAIIIDMSETLHAADPNARISMTSADLLDLIHSQRDTTDNPF